MKTLRESAKGQVCLVRIPGVCTHDSETTVLAHLNGGGMGMKQPDIFGCFACNNCHSAIDRRFKTDYTPEQLLLFHYHAVHRTQRWWLENGYIEIPGG
jgi:hypothetical protein